MALLTSLDKPRSKGGILDGNIIAFSGLGETLLATGALQVDYFLEEKTSTETTLIPFPSQPQNVQVRRIYNEQTIYTFDADFAYREISAPRIVEVTLQGQTGMALRLGINKDGITYTEGYNHLHDFEEFVDRYHHKAQSHRSPVVFNVQSLQNDLDYRSRPYLIFRGIKENLHGRCVVKDLSYQRSVTNHRLGSFQWAMTLQIYDKAEAKDPTGFGWMDWADGVQNTLNSITGLSEAVQLGAVATASQVTGDINSIMQSASGIANSIRRVEDRAYGVANMAIGVVNQINKTARAWAMFGANKYKEKWDDFTEGTENKWDNAWNTNHWAESKVANGNRTGTDQWVDSAPVMETQSNQLLVQQYNLTEMLYQGWLLRGYVGGGAMEDITIDSTYGFLGRKYGFEALASLNPDIELVSAKAKSNTHSMSYEMRAGQSLLNIASFFLGDPSEWTTIAELNDCIDAYTYADNTPIVAGDTILIPTLAMEFSDQNHDPSVNTTDADLIGYDFEFRDGDLIIDTEGFRLVGGGENLRASIIRRLTVSLGEITYSPEYGVNFAIIGRKINEISSSLIGAKLRQCLLQDSRILDVRDILMEVDSKNSTTLNISLTCICVGQHDIVINTDLDTQ